MGLREMIEILSGSFTPFEELVGKTAARVERVDNLDGGNEGILFEFDDGSLYHLVHHQDCCEGVSIEDIEGDLEDLIGSPLTMAEESYSDALEGSDHEWYDGHATWSFYRFATVKGYVTIRFYGSSNGYYSETAGLYRIDTP